MTGTFRNPVLPGPHPDPSITRVGDDFYLVTSTFEYFPGLPIYHSRDLVDWRLIGHVLDRPEQLPLDGVRCSGGLFAPTIRYADGVFYVTCTLVGGSRRSGHFVVTTTDPATPWSDPAWLDDANGFDPSLFFDDDGRGWFCAATQQDDAGHTAVWVQEFDRDKLALTGERHAIWHGALRDARWAEGPHIYRIHGHCYLLAAEGGTSFDHAVVVARSDNVVGPYVGCPRNPVATTRHLGRRAPIVAVGHADLVDIADDDWWAVLLGVRDNEEGNLGRETFLTPVSWEDGWPVFNPGVGQVRLEERRPALRPAPCEPLPARNSFDTADLHPSWMFLRTPRETWWSLTERPSYLRLAVRPETLGELANPSFVCRRQQHRDFIATSELDFEPATGTECAGLAVVQSDDFQIRLEICRENGSRQARAVRRTHGNDDVLATAPIGAGPPRLAVRGEGPRYTLSVDDVALAEVDGSHLSYAEAGGFFGAVVGMFATGNGEPSNNVADFGWFEYLPKPSSEPTTEPTAEPRAGRAAALEPGPRGHAYPETTEPEEESL